MAKRSNCVSKLVRLKQENTARTHARARSNSRSNLRSWLAAKHNRSPCRAEASRLSTGIALPSQTPSSSTDTIVSTSTIARSLASTPQAVPKFSFVSPAKRRSVNRPMTHASTSCAFVLVALAACGGHHPATTPERSGDEPTELETGAGPSMRTIDPDRRLYSFDDPITLEIEVQHHLLPPGGWGPRTSSPPKRVHFSANLLELLSGRRFERNLTVQEAPTRLVLKPARAFASETHPVRFGKRTRTLHYVLSMTRRGQTFEMPIRWRTQIRIGQKHFSFANFTRVSRRQHTRILDFRNQLTLRILPVRIGRTSYSEGRAMQRAENGGTGGAGRVWDSAR